MAKKRVPLFQEPRSFTTVDPDATKGAQLGVNLYGPDGKLLTAAQILNPSTGQGTSNTATIWRFIREVPENIKKLAVLVGRGFAARTLDGEWALRTLEAGAGIEVENGDGDDGNPVVGLNEASVASLALADSAVQEIVPGGGIDVDNTDPQRPVLTVTAGGGFVPYRIPDGQVFAIPLNQQALFTLPIELGAGSSLDIDGALEEVS